MKISSSTLLAALFAFGSFASAVPIIHYTEDSTDFLTVQNNKKGMVSHATVSLPALREKNLGSPAQIAAMLNQQIKERSTAKQAEPTSADPEEKTLDSILNETIYQVLFIDSNMQVNACGSASCIDSDGIFITNEHVAKEINQPGLTCYLVGMNGTAYKVDECLYMNEKIDLALLYVNTHNLPYLKVNPKYTPKGGELGSTKGFPKGLDVHGWVGEDKNEERAKANFSKFLNKYPLPQFTNGAISSVSDIDGVDTIHHHIPISPGSSGSPLLNEQGELIGVNKATVVNSQNMNLATKISALKKFIPEMRSEKARNAMYRIFGRN